MVHRVECLSIIDGNCGGPGGWFMLIETYSDGGGERKESGGGGVSGFEAVLGVVYGKGRSQGREEKSLQNLGRRAEERDGTVGRALVGWLTCF